MAIHDIYEKYEKEGLTVSIVIIIIKIIIAWDIKR